MKILVTGGTGYIGSHTCVELIQAGYEIVILDNLSNSKFEALNRIKKITNASEIPFYQVDLLEEAKVFQILQNEKIEAVIHFAGLKAVGESCEKPLAYYHNNIGGSLSLFRAMQKADVKKIVFSSSATVYGFSQNVPFSEDEPLSATNPYGRTKLMIEDILWDLYAADSTWQISLLRYFNPVGAHSSGLIGEDPNGIPNNLIPFISQVAIGKRAHVSVFGNDYPTKDGTGERDYIHVVDLAKAHLYALEKLDEKHGCQPYNIGCGRAFSVLEMIAAFEKASGKTIPYEITERRSGDVAVSYANPKKAEEKLGWKAEKTLDDICKEAWNWQKHNPNGYE
jgi:UDP-glucose 4-epimerase